MNRISSVAMVAAGLMLGGWAGVLRADPNPAPASPAAAVPATATAPLALHTYLMDGSIITGKLGIKQFTVETAYGTLTIPVADVQVLRPGLDSHPEIAAKIAAYIDKLDSADFNEREKAQKGLEALGPAIRNELAKYVKDPSAERRNRVQAILDEFDQESGDSDSGTPAAQPWVHGDTLATPQFTVVGRVMPRQFEIVTAYGPLTVKLDDVRVLQRAEPAGREEISKTVDVQGQNNINTNPRSTTIHVQKGDQVTVTADGTITLSPWGSNALCTPEGAANYGWFVPGRIAMGALVARVGRDGPVFKVGSKSAFTADHSGDLVFGVGMNPEYANNNFPGQFRVKVRVKPKD